MTRKPSANVPPIRAKQEVPTQCFPVSSENLTGNPADVEVNSSLQLQTEVARKWRVCVLYSNADLISADLQTHTHTLSTTHDLSENKL